MGKRMWLEKRLAELGLRQADLAREMGLTDVKVHQIVKGTRQVQPREWAPMARALKMSMAELGKELGIAALAELQAPDLSTEFKLNDGNLVQNNGFPSARIGGTVKDLPVYGAAEGGEGVMLLDNEPIEYMDRPVELQGVKGAFAVYVVNESMYPAYEPGDKIHINPHKPLIPNKDVLFIRADVDGTRHATIKRLLKATPTIWKVKQFNPEKPLELPRKVWQTAYRIVGSTRGD